MPAVEQQQSGLNSLKKREESGQREKCLARCTLEDIRLDVSRFMSHCGILESSQR